MSPPPGPPGPPGRLRRAEGPEQNQGQNLSVSIERLQGIGEIMMVKKEAPGTKRRGEAYYLYIYLCRRRNKH